MMIPGQDGQMQEQLDLSKTTEINCDECENKTFRQTLLLRNLSSLVSPSGQDTIVPMQVFACDKCGHVNKEFSNIAGIQ